MDASQPKAELGGGVGRQGAERGLLWCAAVRVLAESGEAGSPGDRPVSVPLPYQAASCPPHGGSHLISEPSTLLEAIQDPEGFVFV